MAEPETTDCRPMARTMLGRARGAGRRTCGALNASGEVPPRQQRLQAPSDIAGSGGAPRQATAWETEARSVAPFLAGIVNTEGPRP